MNTSSRKQRDIQEREAQILRLARSLLEESGYLGLSMDAIAASLEYSKGTIYNHFGCKEEIIIALAVETMGKRTDLFERAAAYQGTPRERMTAVGAAAELFLKLYPSHFHVEQLIRSYSIWEKTSEKRRQTMRISETRCMGIVSGIVRDAIAQGHLELPEDTFPEDLVFGLWSQTYGAHSIIATSGSMADLGVHDPFAAVRHSIHMCLDGFGWLPLSTDYDYQGLFDRLLQEVFPDECLQYQPA